MSKKDDVAAAKALLALAEGEAGDGSVLDVVDAPAAPVKVLDRYKPYGTVQPPEGVKRYFQDGEYFDVKGSLVKE